MPRSWSMFSLQSQQSSFSGLSLDPSHILKNSEVCTDFVFCFHFITIEIYHTPFLFHHLLSSAVHRNITLLWTWDWICPSLHKKKINRSILISMMWVAPQRPGIQKVTHLLTNCSVYFYSSWEVLGNHECLASQLCDVCPALHTHRKYCP